MQPPGEDALTSTLTEVKENETFADETICRWDARLGKP